MARAAKKTKPLLEVAQSVPAPKPGIPGERFRVLAKDAINDEERLAVVGKQYPGILQVLFISKRQAEWAFYVYLRELEEQFRQSPLNVLNRLRDLSCEVLEKTDLVVEEDTAEFLHRMEKYRNSPDCRRYELFPNEDKKRVITLCVAFRARVYVLPEGKKPMAKASLKDKPLSGMAALERSLAAMSDVELVRSISHQIGSCYFSRGERIILTACELQIRHEGEESFSFHGPLQRDAYEELACNVHLRERVPFYEDSKKVGAVIYNRLPGFLEDCSLTELKPSKWFRFRFFTPLSKEEVEPPWHRQLDLFPKRQVSLFDLEAPWFF